MLRQQNVDVLILGAGWTSTFLIPLLKSEGVTYSATTTSGRNGTLKFRFDVRDSSTEQYRQLPNARTVLVTFPLKGATEAALIHTLYHQTHHDTHPYEQQQEERQQHGASVPDETFTTATTATTTAPTPTAKKRSQWIILGTTFIWQSPSGWSDHRSAYNTRDPRAQAEDELLRRGGASLNLSGLYDDGPRHPRAWIGRVAVTKGQLATKTTLHLVHGQDVARALLGLHSTFTPGERWLLTDLHVYDWWDLAVEFADGAEEANWVKEEDEKRRIGPDGDGAKGDGADEEQLEASREGGRSPKGQRHERTEYPYRRWVLELMGENGVRALPRNTETLGRRLDSRAFWAKIGVQPTVGRLR